MKTTIPTVAEMQKAIEEMKGPRDLEKAKEAAKEMEEQREEIRRRIGNVNTAELLEDAI